jgi:hypothetical protein
MHTAPCEWYTFIYLHNEWEHAMESCFIWYPLSTAAAATTSDAVAEKPSALCESLFYYLTLPNTLGTGDRFGAHFCAYSLLRMYIQLPLDNDRLINIRSNEFTCALCADMAQLSSFFRRFDSVAWSPVSWIKCERRTKNRSMFCARPDFFSHTTYSSTQTLSCYMCGGFYRESGGLDLYHFHLHKMLTAQGRWGWDQNKKRSVCVYTL